VLSTRVSGSFSPRVEASHFTVGVCVVERGDVTVKLTKAQDYLAGVAIISLLGILRSRAGTNTLRDIIDCISSPGLFRTDNILRIHEYSYIRGYPRKRGSRSAGRISFLFWKEILKSSHVPRSNRSKCLVEAPRRELSRALRSR
jgi:hypothetical protein